MKKLTAEAILNIAGIPITEAAIQKLNRSPGPTAEISRLRSVQQRRSTNEAYEFPMKREPGFPGLSQSEYDWYFQTAGGRIVEMEIDQRGEVGLTNYGGPKDYFQRRLDDTPALFLDPDGYDQMRFVDWQTELGNTHDEPNGDNLGLYGDFLNERVKREKLIVIKYRYEENITWVVLKQADWQQVIKMSSEIADRRSLGR